MTVIEEDPTTGEERERIVLLQEPQAIALHYLQRDFWLDLLFAFPWRGLSALLLPRRKVRVWVYCVLSRSRVLVVVVVV